MSDCLTLAPGWMVALFAETETGGDIFGGKSEVHFLDPRSFRDLLGFHVELSRKQ